MTDQIPADLADKVRKIAAEMRDAMRREEDGYLYADFLSDMSDYIRDLEALLPAPPRPTLADMTDEERAECQWMQADVKGYESRVVIVNPYWEEGRARVMWLHTRMNPVSWKSVTPRPDLPRLEWPGDAPTAPDHLAVGTVIESAADPRLAALPVGSILLDSNEEATTMRYWGWSGAGYAPEEDGGAEFGPWTVLHIPKEEIS